MESRRPDIAKIWETCEQLVRKQANDYKQSRYNTHKDSQRTLLPHLVITKVLNKIILSLLRGSIVDFQTAAMIICAFTLTRKTRNANRYIVFFNRISTVSYFHVYLFKKFNNVLLIFLQF